MKVTTNNMYNFVFSIMLILYFFSITVFINSFKLLEIYGMDNLDYLEGQYTNSYRYKINKFLLRNR